MSSDVRKALKNKGFFPRPGGMPAPIGKPEVRDIDQFRLDLRKTRDGESMAASEYSVLAGWAERIGLTEAGRKLRKISLDEMEHHKVLDDMLSRRLE